MGGAHSTSTKRPSGDGSARSSIEDGAICELTPAVRASARLACGTRTRRHPTRRRRPRTSGSQPGRDLLNGGPSGARGTRAGRAPGTMAATSAAVRHPVERAVHDWLRCSVPMRCALAVAASANHNPTPEGAKGERYPRCVGRPEGNACSSRRMPVMRCSGPPPTGVRVNDVGCRARLVVRLGLKRRQVSVPAGRSAIVSSGG